MGRSDRETEHGGTATATQTLRRTHTRTRAVWPDDATGRKLWMTACSSRAVRDASASGEPQSPSNGHHAWTVALVAAIAIGYVTEPVDRCPRLDRSRSFLPLLLPRPTQSSPTPSTAVVHRTHIDWHTAPTLSQPATVADRCVLHPTSFHCLGSRLASSELPHLPPGVPRPFATVFRLTSPLRSLTCPAHLKRSERCRPLSLCPPLRASVCHCCSLCRTAM